MKKSIFITLLIILDIITTYLNVNYEANPISVFLINNHLFVPIKLVLLSIILLGIKYAYKTRFKKLFNVILNVTIFFFIFVVINNVICLII